MHRQLTFSWAEPHVSPSPSLDSEEDWMTRVATWPSDFASLLESCGRDGSGGKTFPEFCRPGPDLSRRVIWKKDKNGKLKRRVISDASSLRWKNSGTASAGESLTLNTSESPSVVVESSLLDILETGDVPPRYFLTPKACAGILRRAKKRGKTLPEPLRVALEQVVGLAPTSIRAGV